MVVDCCCVDSISGVWNEELDEEAACYSRHVDDPRRVTIQLVVPCTARRRHRMTHPLDDQLEVTASGGFLVEIKTDHCPLEHRSRRKNLFDCQIDWRQRQFCNNNKRIIIIRYQQLYTWDIQQQIWTWR